MGGWRKLIVDFNTITSRNNPWTIRTEKNELNNYEIAELLSGLERAEVWYADWSNGHRCGYPPRYGTVIVEMKWRRTITPFSKDLVFRGEFWGGNVWSATFWGIINDDLSLVYVDYLCDGMVALATLRDVLRMLLGADICRDYFEIFGASIQYCDP